MCVPHIFHQIDLNPAELRIEAGFETEEKYIFSKLHSTIKKMTDSILHTSHTHEVTMCTLATIKKITDKVMT